MAHRVEIYDEAMTDVLDVRYYCSDAHAKKDPDYSGWNGGHEVYDIPQWCGTCNEAIGYYRWINGTKCIEWVSPEQQEEEQLAEAQAECDKQTHIDEAPLKVTLKVLGLALAKEMKKDLS
jgi:hypothetical protein